MKKYALILVFIILLAQIGFASAENILQVSVNMDKEQNVVLEDMKVISGKEGKYYGESGDYIFQILDENGELIWEQRREIEFIIYTDPPREIDNKTEMIRTSYRGDFREFRILHNEEEIFSKSIALCNNNSICDNYETYFSCPSDCSSHAEDGICNPEVDGSCDPDCVNDSDLDCLCGDGKCDIEKGENYEICPEDCDSGSSDNYCDGEEDGICDPDCETFQDPDCEQNVSEGCDEDGVCEPEQGENYGNCESDCDSGSSDNYCDGEEDGICDPDCPVELDPDCEGSVQEGTPIWLYGVLFGIVILILFVVMMSVKVER